MSADRAAFKTGVDALNDLRVSVHDSDADQQIASFLGRLLWELDPGQSRPLVLVAIGTDRLTGDSLGPLVGSRAQALAPEMPVYGTLEEPVHAVNLADTIKEINQVYMAPLVVAVDACLGQAHNVGTVSVGRGALCPGTGVHKDLPPVGEIFISGVVNVGGFLEFLVLQNTRLCLVMRIAECIASASGNGQYRPGNSNICRQNQLKKKYKRSIRTLDKGGGVRNSYASAGAALCQGGNDLLVGGLAEILVELTHGIKIFGDQQADDLVGIRPEPGEGIRGGDRHRQHQPAWLLPAQRAQGRLNSVARGNTVIHQDHDALPVFWGPGPAPASR